MLYQVRVVARISIGLAYLLILERNQDEYLNGSNISSEIICDTDRSSVA
jgi:hypothetical protein